MNTPREYTAYSGDKFEIEWYFDNRGKSQALEYYLSLLKNQRIEVLKLFKHIGDTGEIKNKENFGMKKKRYMRLNQNQIVFCVFSLKEAKLLLQMPLGKNKTNFQKENRKKL